MQASASPSVSGQLRDRRGEMSGRCVCSGGGDQRCGRVGKGGSGVGIKVLNLELK